MQVFVDDDIAWYLFFSFSFSSSSFCEQQSQHFGSHRHRCCHQCRRRFSPRSAGQQRAAVPV